MRTLHHRVFDKVGVFNIELLLWLLSVIIDYGFGWKKKIKKRSKLSDCLLSRPNISLVIYLSQFEGNFYHFIACLFFTSDTVLIKQLLQIRRISFFFSNLYIYSCAKITYKYQSVISWCKSSLYWLWVQFKKKFENPIGNESNFLKIKNFQIWFFFPNFE